MPNRRSAIGVAQFKIVPLALACGWAIGLGGVLAARGDEKMTPAVARKAEPFRLQDVRLLEGPLRHAMELDRKYLLSLDPDRLLHVFRINAGLPSTVRPYGGWMAPGHNSRGEFVGHYLSACAMMYASTGGRQLVERADRVVAGLAACQEKVGTGLLHTHRDTFTTRCQAPVPFWYQIHKVLAGLLDVHQECHNVQALEVARKLGDWACRSADKFSDSQLQAMLSLEHGGINEALANLAARTGDPKYLRLSLRFNHMAVLGPATKQTDCLDGLHANTQIPKFIGAARQYELTGDESLRTAARFFWETVVQQRSYAIGGNSDGEIFTRKATLSRALSPSTCETCNTYNLLKLTRLLFLSDPRAEYADYYERTIYNQILGSQHPETGMLAYFSPLDGSAKAFGTPEDSFWCCYGTGIENHAKYGDSIYFHDGGDRVWINLFVASELTWKERGLTLRQETQFPETETSRLTFTCQKPVRLTLHVRHPRWATSGIHIAVNGQEQAVESRPGSYLSLARQWQTGDTVDLRMPMSVSTEAFRDHPRRLAILYGPLVLCSTVGAGKPAPAIVSEIDRIPLGIKPAGMPLCFTGSPAIFRRLGAEQGTVVTLAPYYLEYQQPCVVYWDVLTREEAAKSLGPQTIPLVNAGFESAEPHQGWSLHAYGAKPKLATDAIVRHEGRQSLRISADAPSDIALGQEINLRPGRWYRLAGWIRTEKLDPCGAPVCGTFQVQFPGGRGVVASGKNHSGTNDWTQETIYFTPPAGGRTRIAVFFVGYGKGTGTAWFDGLALQEISTGVTRLTVTNEPICPATISPYQCGQFIEYLCGMTPSMFAEQVFDGSFEGVPPYRVAFRKETDRLEKPWYPDGAVHRGDFTLDAADVPNGKVAQRIIQKPGDPCTLGISQAGKHTKAGEPLRCSLYLRARGLQSPVDVAIWGQGQTYASATFRPTQQWQRFEAVLKPDRTDPAATLSISFRGPGTLWIDQVSLMSADNVYGWRRDVADALKALRPGIIRFGGSTIEGFDWTATIGDPANRVPFTTCWGGLEPGNAGLEEFVQLCRWVGAEPLICVRFTGRTPREAAQQVEYFNGADTTPMGRLRARNGHPAPYGVRYWQIGNELGNETYQNGIAEFCKAMKAVDPRIKLLAAYPSAGLLQKAGQYIDYICPHHYGCHNLSSMEADVARCQKLIAENAPGRTIRLGITEWNTTAGDWGLGRAKLWTLDNALWCSRYHNFMHRHCDLIEIANRSNLADSFCSGILQTSGTGLFKTPAYYAQQLYAKHAGARPLKVFVDSEFPSDPALDTSATLSEDGRTVVLFVVNPTTESQSRTLDLTALAPLDLNVHVWTLADTLAAGQCDAANDWRYPDRIRTVPGNATLDGAKLVYRFPPLSLTVLEAQRKP